MTIALILTTVLATSVLSGVVGMAGGMILMAILLAVTPVAHAMVLHGFVQSIANGSRFWFLRKSVVWEVLPPYLLGTVLAVGPFLALSVLPSKHFVLIFLGLVPLVSHLQPSSVTLDIRKPATAFACGLLVVFTQLLSGTSGPLLDFFYQKSPLNRFQIVASKALTQTIGHLCKTGYYAYAAYVVAESPLPSTWGWLLVAAGALALVGTRFGTHLLHRLQEQTFQKYVPWIIDAIGVLCVVQGVVGLVQGAA